MNLPPLTPLMILTCLALVLCSGVAMAQQSPVAPGAKPEKVSSEYLFTEGPAVDKEGNVYFTDQPNDRIVKWSAADGKFTDWLKPCGRSNGLCVDNDGRSIIACADDKNELWSIDIATKKATVLVKEYNGKLLNGPNDVWVRPDGGIYFTDPFYKREYWSRGPSEQVEAVYFLAPDRKTATRVAEDLKQPNGIIGTPDGKTLYVADIGGKKTYSYDIGADGKLTNKKLFCEMGSDGMTLDNAGNLYLTGKGVTVFDKTGKKVATIEIKEPWTANVSFAGKDNDVLFITASKAVYTVKMSVKGAGSQ